MAVQHQLEEPAAERIAPPREGQLAAAIIARVYTQCAKLAQEHRDGDVVNAADTLSLFTTRGNSTSTRLHSIRLWKVDALINLGRSREALEFLRWLEEFNGPSFLTRERLARIYLFLGQYEDCITAVDDSIIALPLDKKLSSSFHKLCHLRAEASCALGRHDEGRSFLLKVLSGESPTYDDMGSLRRTINSPAALEEMFTFLAPHFSYPGHRARHALFHYSIACRDNGRIDRAIYTARQRFLTGLQVVGWGEREPPVKVNWTGQAALALLDLRTDLHSLNLEFFLISGTLLGCVRDQGIIGHDKDIDVGVLTDYPAASLRQALATSGRFKVKNLTTDKLVQVQHSNGVMIDVFMHWREDGLIYHEGQKTRWWNSEFGLQEADFLGKTFMIPTNPEVYLVENYGKGWTVPEPDFETFVDTPNMIIQDDDHMRWYYYSKLHDYYFAGKPAQLRKVWQALDRLMPNDSVIRAAVNRVLSEASQPQPAGQTPKLTAV